MQTKNTQGMHRSQLSETSSTAWHALALPDIVGMLHTDPERGLSAEHAAHALQEIGPNRLQAAHETSPWTILFAQFKNILILILILAVGLSALLGHEIEAIAIGIIVLFAVILGFVQEYRAEKAIDALRKMAAPTATVIRDDEELELPAVDLVPGDIVLLAAGDHVPADARLLESISLQTDEASLTGESLPVMKTADTLPDAPLSLGDRRNLTYAGTIVTYGRGRAVVVATGMQTEFGKIAGMLQSVETGETPLQQNLDRLGKNLGKAALVVVAVITLLGIARGQPLLDMLIFGIALAVAVVPEALPAVVTISLAIGVQKMVKRHALVRRLSAVETLGSTSVICSDKTGTLTKDEMTARRIWAAGTVIEVTGVGYAPEGTFEKDGKPVDVSPALRELLIAGALASDARLVHEQDAGWDIKGDPTEGALISAAAKAGLKKIDLEEQHPRVAEIPFTSETKRMTTLHKFPEGLRAFAKGAPEVLLDACTHVLEEGGVQPLTKEKRAQIHEAAKNMGEQALRVLGIAMKSAERIEDAETEMTFLGLVGMIDPPRPEAKQAIEKCKAAGIRVVMITGDHPVTARAVAKELGILTGEDLVTGAELEAMDDATFEKRVSHIAVYARVAPAHKLRVVAALQAQGHIVAMTGDGVNDAPALKKADIGIAMGITGTDVTKEASAMMLTDDNFASIVAAVEEGRGIFGNIKKYLTYLLSSNIGEICLLTAASLLGLPLPLSAVQILYVNLATDGLPALALAVDPPEHDVMRRPPRDPRGSIFTRRNFSLMLTGGLWSMLVNLTLFMWALRSGRPVAEAMTMVFVSLVLIEFFKAYAFRSDHFSIFRRPFANTWLNLSILWELGLLVCIVYVSFFQIAFGTVSLPARDLLLVFAFAVSVIPALEVMKWIQRRRS